MSPLLEHETDPPQLAGVGMINVNLRVPLRTAQYEALAGIPAPRLGALAAELRARIDKWIRDEIGTPPREPRRPPPKPPADSPSSLSPCVPPSLSSEVPS